MYIMSLYFSLHFHILSFPSSCFLSVPFILSISSTTMAGDHELKKMWAVLFVLILVSIQNLNTLVMGKTLESGPRFGGKIPGIGGGIPGIGGGRGPGFGPGPGTGGGGSQVPCNFIFGDSLVDNGNNNFIATVARANYFPYGIDFGRGPTGRFSNGLTTADVISQQLGFNDFIPPYAQATGRAILGGVNYASAAAGIRDETGQQFGDRITFNRQLRNFRNTVQQVVSILGDENTAANYLSRCIYLVGLGNNDYLNNYFLPLIYPTSRLYTPAQYANVLIQQYTQQLRTLYNYGARKVVIIGVAPIGCTPNALAQGSPDGRQCVERINSACRLFNDRVRNVVDNFNNNLPNAKFIYANAYGIFDDILTNSASYGFTVTNSGCCGVGRNNGQFTCLPLQPPCLNRDQHAFWDAFHPSEAANIIVGRRSYSAQTSTDTYPIDIQRLAQL